jgi:pseudouridine-5'-phosphate glycosidase/pseudouridine kinase
LRSLGGILRVAEEVSDAVAMNRPVVALESTIYTHGALGADLNLEAIVRKHGAVPAVCGILNGIPTVGLTPAEVDLMVNEGAKKASRRDLAYLVGLVSVTEHVSSLLSLFCLLQERNLDPGWS